MVSIRTKRLILLAFPADFAIPDLSRPSAVKALLKAHSKFDENSGDPTILRSETPPDLRFMCVDPVKSQRVGLITSSRAHDLDAWMVGYYIFHPLMGLGFATEALQAVVDWLREDPEVKAIVSETYSDFEPSIKVMKKVGMSEVDANVGPELVRYAIVRPDSEIDLREHQVLTLIPFVYPRAYALRHLLRWQFKQDVALVPLMVCAFLMFASQERAWRLVGLLGVLVCFAVVLNRIIRSFGNPGEETLLQFRDRGLFYVNRSGTGDLVPWDVFSEFRIPRTSGIELWNGQNWYWIPPQAFSDTTLKLTKQFLTDHGVKSDESAT